MYKSPRLSSWLMNACQESFPILKPMNLPSWLWSFLSLHSLPTKPVHAKPYWTLLYWLQHEFPELQSLCSSWIKSIFANLNLSQFNSFLRLTVIKYPFSEGRTHCPSPRILVPPQELNPGPLQWKHILTIGSLRIPVIVWYIYILLNNCSKMSLKLFISFWFFTWYTLYQIII